MAYNTLDFFIAAADTQKTVSAMFVTQSSRKCNCGFFILNAQKVKEVENGRT